MDVRVEVHRAGKWVDIDQDSVQRWKVGRWADVDDVMVPHRIRATASGPGMPTVAMDVVADAELVVERVEVTKTPDRPSLAERNEWAKVHVPTLLEAAIQRVAQRVDEAGRMMFPTEPVGPAIDRARRANRRRRVDIEKAVRVYRQAVEDGAPAPRQAVAVALDVSPRTASRLLDDARSLQLLPPTTQGKAKA